jgi:anti-sigma factor RsiW
MSQNNCAAVRVQLSAYLDGELDAAQSEALLAHLNECADCTTFYNTLRKTLMLYRAMPPDALDADARTRLRHVLQLDQT